jgi:uncharacterized delta-60 repeat protein
MNARPFYKNNLRILWVAGIFALLLSATSVFAAGGALDPSFGSNGVVAVKFNSMPSSANEIVLQADGKIVTLGTVKLSDSQSSKILTRYNSNGTLDNTFGVSGSVVIAVDSFSGSKLALQPGGKLIVGGLSIGKFAVVRYNSNGTLDTSFGANGMGVLDFRNFSGSLADMAIQSDGKIVMVGDQTTDQSNYTEFFIARFTNNGIPDSTFVANGFNILDSNNFPNNRYNYGEAVLIQPDGKIVMSGNMMDNDGKADLSLARLNSDGSLDKSAFGTNGLGTVTTLIPPDFQNSRGALALQADGKIIVGGTTNGNLTVVRYNPNGVLDTTFGGTGIVNTDFGSNEQTDDLVLQADGKIVVVGTTSSLGFLNDFLLVRYNTDGSLDSMFGANGKVISDFGNSADTALGIILQPDNKGIVAGSSGDNAIMARYDMGASSTTQTSIVFKSADVYDGWILETGENSSAGGTLDKTSTIINVGDDAKNSQYRGILSFNTISIPDNVIVTSAQVKIKRQGFVGVDAFKTHNDLLLEIRCGTFSNSIALTASDFSAIANIGSPRDKFPATSISDWYTADLSNINLGLINKYGITQFRLLFSKDDDNDRVADYIKFFSGNAASADQPQLVVTYSTTSSGPNANQPPVITSNGGLATASVNVLENTTAVTTVTATDADSQVITYSILNGMDSALFSINANTGLLTFVNAPNYEALSLGTVYHVTVQASDGNLAATQDIAVTVVNVNEYAPEISSNGGGASANISLPEKTTAVTTVAASDADSQTPTYSIIGGADAALFSINPSTGELAFVTAPSYNAPNDAGLDHIYNVTVQASDGALTDSQELVISITNSNPSTGGTVDLTFGSNGVAATKFNGLPSSIRDIILQPDGKIVVLGNNQSAKIIARYNTNGSLDTTFDSNGITSIDFPSFLGKALALQPDGKLVVAGLQKGFAAVRYNSNGTLDTSFGANGLATLDPVNTSIDIYYFVEDVAIQPDGKIVMAGSYSIGNHIEIEVVRFNSDGTRDVINPLDWGAFGSQYNYGKAVTIQPDNKIVVSGDMVSCCDSYHYITLARLDPNVQHLDRSTFGSGSGVVTAPLNYFQHSSGALALQPDGKIVLAGTILGTDWETPQNLALARFNSDGSQDTTFGGTGIVVTDFGAQESAANLVIQASGKIILAGTTANAGASDFLLVRYNSDGSLDTSFGSNGKVVTDFGNSAESATGIVQQADGKVIVSGTSGENAILARYDTGVSGITNTASFNSVGAYDGWILESGENSSKGGTLDKISNVFYLGDDDKDRQYRSILSFNTNSIPDNVTLTSAQVKIKKQGIVGADPFKTHGNLLLEIRNGTFSNDIALSSEDFSAIANIGSTKDSFSAADAGWYTANLSNVNLGFVNKYGETQFRLLFTKDDNDDMSADYAKFFSGNATADQPQLIVMYSATSGGINQPPVINGGSALSVSIPENTTVVTAVTALDPNGQSITYSISGVDAGKFSISPTTGILTFLTAPDFESIPSGTIYHVTAQASDGILTSTQDISVTVTPVNEFAPVVVTSNGSGAVVNISVPENTMDVTTITATDADLPPQPIEYVFAGGADDSLFNFDPSTGKLSFVTAPSYNAPNDAGLDHVYNVKFEVNDGEFVANLELVISIINPNSNPVPTPTAGFTALHQFGSQANNGRIPYGLLVLHDGVFYGTTTYGGPPYDVPPTNPANKGNLFKMNMDGTGFTVLHEFVGGANDGWKPWSGLTISGDTIYGSTVYGGPRGESGGVIYAMNTNGGGFRLLHTFGEPGDGFGGSTSPILVGNTLYGLTRWGGNGTGTIYSYDTSSGVYRQLYRFALNGSDGSTPLGTLTAANDGYLYGLTWLGGNNNMGTLFRIKPDGSAFETLYHFAGGAQGKYPYDTLAFDGNHTLYGTTLGEYGVDLSDLGTLFKYDLTNKAYSVLHKFAGGANDGGKPNGSMILSPDGLTIYGTTHGDDAWGGKEFGILYQMNIDGTGFNQLYEFSGGTAGATPMRTPVLINGALYGMTAYGGAENYGLIYRFQLPTAPIGLSSLAVPNINLYSPVITSSGGISIPENSVAVTTVTATDADVPAQPLAYSIVGGADAALFNINSTTGELTFISAPDYETPKDAGSDNIYNVTVQASDGTLTTTQDISVTVTAVADNTPVITSNANVSISENATAVTTLTTTDSDLPAQPLTYSIVGGADAALFAVNPSTGELTFIAAPDYETPKDAGADNVYNVTLQASDGTLSAAQDVIVTVTPVNDNTPVITSPASFGVLENTTTIATVSATDADLPAQTLTYSIVGGPDAALFTINASTGALAFIAAHDYELPNDVGSDNVYNLTVQASDGTLNTTQDIAVGILPVNDNSPVITSLNSFSVPENTTAIAVLTALDADRPAQALVYSISGGADAAKFSIVSATGELKFIAAPVFAAPTDFNLDNVYEVVIQVSDGVNNSAKNISVQVTKKAP